KNNGKKIRKNYTAKLGISIKAIKNPISI
ncbi:MAG: hypothetical protein RL494_732, partial [Bacteroidota bacterium]